MFSISQTRLDNAFLNVGKQLLPDWCAWLQEEVLLASHERAAGVEGGPRLKDLVLDSCFLLSGARVADADNRRCLSHRLAQLRACTLLNGALRMLAMWSRWRWFDPPAWTRCIPDARPALTREALVPEEEPVFTYVPRNFTHWAYVHASSEAFRHVLPRATPGSRMGEALAYVAFTHDRAIKALEAVFGADADLRTTINMWEMLQVTKGLFRQMAAAREDATEHRWVQQETHEDFERRYITLLKGFAGSHNWRAVVWAHEALLQRQYTDEESVRLKLDEDLGWLEFHLSQKLGAARQILLEYLISRACGLHRELSECAVAIIELRRGVEAFEALAVVRGFESTGFVKSFDWLYAPEAFHIDHLAHEAHLLALRWQDAAATGSRLVTNEYPWGIFNPYSY